LIHLLKQFYGNKEKAMRVVTVAMLLLLSVFSCGTSYAFDCTKLDFGAKLSDIDDGNFVLYNQKDGVSYYNYVGACRLQVHQDACPAISYAFVDGQYYARIIRVTERSKDAVLKKMHASFGPDIKTSKDGDWTIYSCNMASDIELKIKCNDRTGEVKSATYSTALRQKLAKTLKKDPVSEYGK
jgi:hypothetical protein